MRDGALPALPLIDSEGSIVTSLLEGKLSVISGKSLFVNFSSLLG